MLDFGASERWPAKYCARKWEEMHPGRLPFHSGSNILLQDPWGTGQCSPVESLNPSPRPPQQWIWLKWTPIRIPFVLKQSETLPIIPFARNSTKALVSSRSGIVTSSDRIEHTTRKTFQLDSETLDIIIVLMRHDLGSPVPYRFSLSAEKAKLW